MAVSKPLVDARLDHRGRREFDRRAGHRAVRTDDTPGHGRGRGDPQLEIEAGLLFARSQGQGHGLCRGEGRRIVLRQIGADLPVGRRGRGHARIAARLQQVVANPPTARRGHRAARGDIVEHGAPAAREHAVHHGLDDGDRHRDLRFRDRHDVVARDERRQAKLATVVGKGTPRRRELQDPAGHDAPQGAHCEAHGRFAELVDDRAAQHGVLPQANFGVARALAVGQVERVGRPVRASLPEGPGDVAGGGHSERERAGRQIVKNKPTLIIGQQPRAPRAAGRPDGGVAERDAFGSGTDRPGLRGPPGRVASPASTGAARDRQGHGGLGDRLARRSVHDLPQNERRRLGGRHGRAASPGSLALRARAPSALRERRDAARARPDTRDSDQPSRHAILQPSLRRPTRSGSTGRYRAYVLPRSVAASTCILPRWRSRLPRNRTIPTLMRSAMTGSGPGRRKRAVTSNGT